MKTRIFVLTGLLLAGCATAPINLPGLTPAAAGVRAASENAAAGVRGQFVLTVRQIGTTKRGTFLDSRPDYRTFDNLAIAMSHATARKVARHLATPLARLRGRRIVVSGVAKQVRIDLVDVYGHRTGRFYYQTHVNVTSPAQIRFANRPPHVRQRPQAPAN